MIAVTTQDLLRMRIAAQGMQPREAETPVGVARRALGLQAQDVDAAILSVRVRTAGATAADVHAALRSGAIARTWCMRGTLHLLSMDDLRWCTALLGPSARRRMRRRRDQLGLDPQTLEAIGDDLSDLLSGGVTRTRGELAAGLAARGRDLEGQALYHALAFHGLGGRIALVERESGEAAFVAVDRPADASAEHGGEAAFARLARRYLRAYGPATLDDFASWSGLGKRDARNGWRAIESECAAIDAEGVAMTALTSSLARLRMSLEEWPSTPVVQLLPAFDTFLLGYASRTLSVPHEHAKRVHPGGGMIRPSVLTSGGVIGTWSLTKRGTPLTVRIDPFDAVDEHTWEAIRREVEDLARYLETPVVLER